eukprot:275491-Pelagomonas_calceolata.AAC.6
MGKGGVPSAEPDEQEMQEVRGWDGEEAWGDDAKQICSAAWGLITAGDEMQWMEQLNCGDYMQVPGPCCLVHRGFLSVLPVHCGSLSVMSFRKPRQRGHFAQKEKCSACGAYTCGGGCRAYILRKLVHRNHDGIVASGCPWTVCGEVYGDMFPAPAW